MTPLATVARCPLHAVALNQPDSCFNLQAARRLESLRLTALLEDAAVRRETALNSLQRTTNSGGRLKGELDVIFASTESLIEKAIACRKELAVRAPALLLAFPHLKDFHTKLDQYVDGAVLTLRTRQYVNGDLLALRTRRLGRRAGAYDAVMGQAVRKAKALKAQVSREIQQLALEGELGTHRGEEGNVMNVTISNSTVAALNLGTVVGDLNGSIQTLAPSGQDELAEAVRKLADAISASLELDHKKEMLEFLAHVSEQTALPAEQRKMAPLRASIEALKAGVATAAQLATLWHLVEHALKAGGIIPF